MVLLDRFLTPENNQVAFKITKMETTIVFFDLSKVYLGVCIPEMAESFSYSSLAKPSKGAYLISSDGRAFHSKLPEFDNVRAHVKNILIAV